MAFFSAVIFITTLSHFNLASRNEASSISASVYQKVRYRVRDIVASLQTMQQHVSKDGEEDAELFGKYMFYCRRGRKALETAIEEAQDTDLEKLKSTIEGEEETRDGIQSNIAEDQAKQADAEASIAKAKSLRDEEARFFKQESIPLRKEIAALKSIILAFKPGDGLEAGRHYIGVPILKELWGSMHGDFWKQDRELLKSFLEKVKEGDTIPDKEEMHIFIHATKILEGRLKQMVGEEKSEVGEFSDYKDAVHGKTRALRSGIKEKTKEVQDLDEEMNAQKDDLSDAAMYLMEGRAFLPFIGASENCSRREVEWAQRCHTRTAELITLSESITTLTDDEFLDELFKKGLPTPWQEGSHHALLASKQFNKSNEMGLGSLISLALKGKNASFAKLFGMFDGMAAMLGKEGNLHPEKFCGQSLNQTEDNLKRLTLTVSDLGTIISGHEKSISTLTQEISEARAGVHMLEEKVLETGKVRKQEHEENSELLTSDNMTLQLFSAARDRLKTYYSKEDLNESEIEGVTLGEVIGPYVKKGDESASIVAMLETTIAELRYEIARVAEQEKQDQEAWEKLITNSVQDHALGTKSISDKQGEKEELETTVTTVDKQKAEKMQEVKASTIYLSELQGNNIGFMRPAVCSEARKAVSISPQGIATPDHTKVNLPKHISLW